MQQSRDSLLFEPLAVRQWTIKNRIVMPPMRSFRELVGPDGIAWYEEHAAGGPGLVIIEATEVPRFDCDITAENLRPVVEAIHRYRTVAAIQLFPVAFGTNVLMKDLTEDEIQQIVHSYRRASRICMQAGMDGVEPHGAHGYLLNRFFSPSHNERTDSYGGSLENRMRLGIEIVRAIKDEVGNRMLLLYRHTPVEKGSYGVEDSLHFARELIAAGVDILDLSPSSNDKPGELAAPFMGLGAKIITVGSMDEPGRAEEVLAEGRADLIAVGRGLIADPKWPRKVTERDWDSIVKCKKCNKKCFGNLGKRIPISCAQWDQI